jgi:cation diffusion facilitator family transporter
MPAMMRNASEKVVYAGVAGNFLVALTKFAAAAVTMSSAMWSEAVHSLVDTGNQLLILYGLRRSERPPDRAHPLGHGRELYFWSFVVSVLIFVIGAGVSVYQGVQHILDPIEIEHPLVNYIVLAVAALFEGVAWYVAFREFRARKGNLGYFEAAQKSKDPAIFILLFEDSAALIGIVFAVAGTAAADGYGMPVFDGVASIAIGVLLATVAGFLARESKQLLIGESAVPELNASICELARAQSGIEHANSLLTVQLAPRQVVAALSLAFADSSTTREIEETVARLEARIRKAHPEIVMVLVKPQSAESYRAAKRLETEAAGSSAARPADNAGLPA